MNTSKVVLRVGLIVVAGIAVVFFFIQRNKPLVADWVTVSNGVARETVLATGRIAGSRVISLSTTRSGLIGRTHSNEGDNVAVGDTLVVFDNREEKNNVAQRKNDLAIARLNLEKLENSSVKLAQERFNQAKVIEEAARRQRSRSDTMYNQGAISQTDFDAAIKEFEVRRSQRIAAEAELVSTREVEVKLGSANVAQAKLLLKDALIALSRTVLTAPSAGRVVEVLVNRGEFVAAGTPQVLFLPDDSSEVVEVQVDESEIGKIRIGQRARVGAVGDDNSIYYDAIVREIVGRINRERGTGTVILGLTSSDVKFPADRTVNAQIIIGESRNATVTEQRFVSQIDSGSIVFIKNGPKAMRKAVKVTGIGNGRCIVEEGVDDGDTLVFAPGMADGTSIVLKSR